MPITDKEKFLISDGYNIHEVRPGERASVCLDGFCWYMQSSLIAVNIGFRTRRFQRKAYLTIFVQKLFK